MNEDWKLDALCREYPLAWFFPDGAGNQTHTNFARAAAICARCAVADECVNYALANHEHYGIWGGTSERQRRIMARDYQAGIPVSVTHHGTYAACARHRRLGEPPCDTCRTFHARSRAERRANNKKAS